MNLNKYTEKAREAIIESQQIAQRANNPQVEPEHVLAALVAQPEGIVPGILRKMSIDPARVADAHGSVTPVYRLVARATEATWLRVRTEDGRTTEETLQPGEEREWVSNRPFVLTVGNAGGVALELNGTALPPLGASGVVISRLVVPSEPR